MERMEMPPLPLKGGCQCGRVRYTINATPYVFYLCHCRQCQKQTSSAFGESLRVRFADIVLTGELQVYERLSESGNRRQGHFCPSCGVRVIHGTVGGEMVNVKAGTLDDASWLVPAGHIWTRSRQRFVAIGTDELTYETQPDDAYEGLAERWQAMIAKS